MNLDESIKRLKEICDKLSDEKTSLEETAKLYKDGMVLSDNCLKLISEMKNVINTLETGEKQ